MNEPYDIIKRVHLTEKASILADTEGKYVFKVKLGSNKVQIRQAIEKLFKKKVLKVNTARFGGKAKRGRTQHPGFTSDWKKAIITLAPGEKIEFV
jgi:large subunit ribosomal protein L23